MLCTRKIVPLLMACCLVAASVHAEPVPSVSSGEEEAVAQQLERAAQRQVIDAAMRAAGTDDAWARSTAQDLRSTMEQAAIAESRVRDLTCASNYCRLVVEHQNWKSQEVLMEKTEGKPGFRLPGMAHLESSGDGTLVTYVYVRNPAVDWPAAPDLLSK